MLCCQSCSWSTERGKWIFPCPRSRLRIWSRETGAAVPSSVSLLIFILRLNLVLTYGIPPELRVGAHLFIFKSPYATGSVPSLSGRATAYRWRSLPRVRRHRASKPQGSSERVLPWQVIMDQLILGLSFPPPLLVWSGCVESARCMYGRTYSKSMDRTGKVTNPARDQLNRGNECPTLKKKHIVSVVFGAGCTPTLLSD